MLRPFWIFSISTCIDINSSKILDNLDKSVVIRGPKMKVTMPKKDYVCPYYEKMIKKFET